MSAQQNELTKQAGQINLRYIIPMEGKGLFNKTITALAEMIYTQTTFKNTNHLINKALSLGIPICPSFNRERILFVITQTIITLVDQIVAKEKQEKKVPIKSEDYLKHDEDHFLLFQNEEKSTLNNSPKCLFGNLNVAVLIYQMFCPKTMIWDAIEKVAAIKRELQREDGIFQVVRLQDRIFKIQNFGNQSNLFRCHCQKFGQQTQKNYVLNCHHCLQEFHPSCQSNVFFCNSCFLRFCLMDLRGELQDAFNYHKEVQVKFFGYLTKDFPNQRDNKVAESIFFQVVKFQLKGFQQQVDRKLKYVEIRICVVNKVFPAEVTLPTRPNLKSRCQPNWFWEIDEVQYYFYLNHNQIKFTEAISRYCIVLKVPHRILERQSNILVIKTVRRNQKYNFKHTNVLTFWPQIENEPKTLMIGVFQIHKKKVGAKNRDIAVLQQSSPDTLRPITVFQSFHYLQFIQKEVNQVPYQIVNIYNQSGSKKIQVPVRSFGCHHIQCFDYVEFKQLLKSKKEKVPKKPKKPKTTGLNIPKQKCIQISSSSSEVVEVFQGDEQQDQPNTSQPLNKSVQSKKIQKVQSVSTQKKKKIKNEPEPDEDLKCPICGRRLLILYQDPHFRQMIRNSGFYKKAKILNNGVYTFEDILTSGQRLDELQL